MKKMLIITVFLLLVFTAGLAVAGNYGLTWEPNQETDLAGYKIHYNQGRPGPPFEKIVDVGNVTNCVVLDLDPNSNYYFAATAYDTSGFESGYSSQVDIWPPMNPKKLKPTGWVKQLLGSVGRLFKQNASTGRAKEKL